MYYHFNYFKKLIYQKGTHQEYPLEHDKEYICNARECIRFPQRGSLQRGQLIRFKYYTVERFHFSSGFHVGRYGKIPGPEVE